MSLPEPETCVSLVSRASTYVCVSIRRKLEKKGACFYYSLLSCSVSKAAWYVGAGVYT